MLGIPLTGQPNARQADSAAFDAKSFRCQEHFAVLLTSKLPIRTKAKDKKGVTEVTPE